MKFPLVVILENIRSAYNVGSIFRTSDAAGVSKLFLCGYTPFPPHNKIPKTALGAIENVEWEHDEKIENVINKLRSENFQIVGVEITEDAVDFREYVYKKPTALIFGNEVNGISSEVLNMCDAKVVIPMYGVKQSLNVSVSLGIAVYEVINQFNK